MKWNYHILFQARSCVCCPMTLPSCRCCIVALNRWHVDANLSFSRKLLLTEVRFSTFSRELLVAYSAVPYFQHFLEGKTFQITTNLGAFRWASGKYAPLESRHRHYLMQFTSEIPFDKGIENLPTDKPYPQLFPAINICMGYKSTVEKKIKRPTT